jgi:IS5 family transposase
MLTLLAGGAVNQQRSFFDEQDRLELISKHGDPLEKLNSCIDWQMFHPLLKRAFKKEPKGPGGRPPYDYLFMFKVIILQRLYNLSDSQTQYQILDRLSFQRFLGQGLYGTVPDEKTIWLFREVLTKRGVIEKLFARYHQTLEKKNLIGHNGSIIDASFVEVPRQRNSREENATVKEGKVPEEWQEDPAKLRQKDTDARWTKKNEETFYGYKDHVKVDAQSKLITAFEVTDASVHDSQVIEPLLDESDRGTELYADSAYRSASIEEKLENKGVKSRIHEKAVRNRPLSKAQIRSNRGKSRIRVRVEHVFATIETSLGGSRIRSIGMARARGIVGLINLTYNIVRSGYLLRA